MKAEEKSEDIRFFRKKHIEYLLALDENEDLDSIGFYLTEHIRMGGAY